MRARWKILGGTTAVGLSLAFLITSHSRQATGDTAPTSSTVPDLVVHDPFTPYPSPGAIAYDQLSDVDKAGVDQIQEVTDTSQPASSYQAFARATEQTSADADRQIAERAVGLTDTAQDGVVP